jgi:hypothetical protein
MSSFFKKFLSKKTNRKNEWDEFCTGLNNMEMNFITESFFKSDNINPKIFKTHFFILNQDDHMALSGETFNEFIHNQNFHNQSTFANQLPRTKSLDYFSSTPMHDRPMGLQLWYMAAYPDVAKWAMNNFELITKLPSIKGYFINDDDEDFIVDGKFRKEIHRASIDYYLKNINANLETQGEWTMYPEFE